MIERELIQTIQVSKGMVVGSTSQLPPDQLLSLYHMKQNQFTVINIERECEYISIIRISIKL